MSSFVLVHGAWGGGWQWRRVATLLQSAGHYVTTPTLTGLGERAHLPLEVDLETHVTDLSEHLWFEDLNEVILVGWSYGVVPCEGAADRVPERLRLLVNLDGFVVDEGRIVDDLSDLPPDLVAQAKRSGWLAPPSADDLADTLADPALRSHVAERERPHPLATLATEFPSGGGNRWQVPHIYLACAQPPFGEAFSEKELNERAAIRNDPRWDYRELPLNHLGLLYAPEVVATSLLELV
jgi:pimeloyl-ACP methyl ester carboxylesterase